jgi:hypothetical protein
MYRLALFACLIGGLRAEIVDRLAITVGRQVITELQIDEEIRVAAFLNRQPVVNDLNARRDAADRLVQQLLVKREMELSRYPLPDESDIDNYLEQVRRDFGSAKDFEQALAADQLSEATLREHLALQLTTLQFIEFRFRPDVGVSDTDIQNQYQRELRTWDADHSGAAPPTLASLRESIRKTLIEQRTDEILATWLEESRKQVNIVYLDRALQ